MGDADRTDPLQRDQPLTCWSRLGVTGVAFCLLKGVLWLLAPALVALMR